MKIAPLDRRVLVHSEFGTADMPLSALRDNPFVVLLGEPGLGKSTALTHEANAEGTDVLTCREAMNGKSLPAGGVVFLDALDEYRSGENRKDKLLQLASALADARVPKWRLTCRAEDWRDVADLKAMQHAVGDEEIIVAHLRPLREDEAVRVLGALGTDDPDAFLRQAHARGAAAFLESPLSLTLLRSVVITGGVWPASRFDLFERAVQALAHEYDPERLADHPQWSAPATIEAASKICFYALTTGEKAIWRASSIAPSDHLSLGALQLQPNLARATLDTALFRGEGHAFWAFHRTIGEFLAARFLAATCTGGGAAPAFPLRRATALITGSDGKAPSELRGLYAWFAAHLHKRGDRKGALRLIEKDAATVLAYGDAAAFDTLGRKAILENLDRDDPYFLSSQEEATVLGGLASEDMADIFAEVLDRDTKGHVHLTVLQALADGPIVQAIQPKLEDIALDPGRPLWMRERAAEIRVKSAVDPAIMRRSLLDGLAALPLTAGSVMIRAQLLASADNGEFAAWDIRRLLADFAALPTKSDEDDIADRGALSGLAWAMRRSAPVDLFDRPIDESEGNRLRERWQTRSFIDQVLTAMILRYPQEDASRVWTWIRNARRHVWEMLDGSVAEAIGAWLDRDPARRETELFLEIARTDLDPDRPWLAINTFHSATRRFPTLGLVETLLGLAEHEKDARKRRHLFHLAAYVARGSALWSQWQDRIVTVLAAEPDNANFIAELLSDPNEEYRREEAARLTRVEQKAEEVRAKNVEGMTPQLGLIASGAAEAYGTLSWAAGHYRNAMITDKLLPLAKIISFTNEEIAAAITEGFVRFAIDTDLKVDAERLGRAQAKLGTYESEYVVAAGIHQALLYGREAELNAAPILRALIGLRQDYFDGEDGALMSRWSSSRLAADPTEGADLLLSYWSSALDAGDEDLDGLHKLVVQEEFGLIRECLLRLLDTRPNLPETALRQALVAGSTVLSTSEMTDFADAYSRMENLDKPKRDTWNFVALALDPEEAASRLSDDAIEAALLAPEGQLFKAMQEISPQPEQLDLIRIAVLGNRHDAKEDDWHKSDRPSASVRGAILRMSASKAVDAGEKLRALAPLVRSNWSAPIAHAAAEHARMIRDNFYVAPDADALRAAISGGRPASPEDLNAIILEELERYRIELRTAPDRPWKNFWNTDQYGAAVSPKIENDCRDYLLGLLKRQFEKYQIVVSLPEAQRGENTRVDILMISHTGKNLPVEAKRHHNSELWSAPLGQLAGYAADEDAHGFGVYLVFWFGMEFPLPSRMDGATMPKTAEGLEGLLRDDLPENLREKLAMVVLDVSRPTEMIKTVKTRDNSKRTNKVKS